MNETWECPKCQTLNAFGDQCYSCGAARPDAPPGIPAAAGGWEPLAEIERPAADPALEASSDGPTGADALPPDLATWGMTPSGEPSPDEDTEPHPCWCNLVKGPHDTRDHPAQRVRRRNRE